MLPELLQRQAQLQKEMQRLMADYVVPMNPAAQESTHIKRNTAASQDGYKVNENTVFRVLKKAEKQKRVELLQVWSQIQPYMKSHGKVHLSAILERAEIVAASDNEFLLAFQFPIHAKMAAQSQELFNEVQSFLQEKMQKMYQMIPLSKEQWVIIRESFMKSDIKPEHENGVPEELAEISEKQPDFVEEAIHLFGEDLVKIEE